MLDLSYAGHTGEGGQPVRPHEIMEGLSLVGGLVLVGLMLSAYMLWRIIRLERRLQTVEALLQASRSGAGS